MFIHFSIRFLIFNYFVDASTGLRLQAEASERHQKCRSVTICKFAFLPHPCISSVLPPGSTLEIQGWALKLISFIQCHYFISRYYLPDEIRGS